MRINVTVKRNTLYSSLILIIILLVSLSVLWIYYSYQSENKPFTSSNSTAVIVDQLSQNHPNQAFVEEATNILTNSSYTVDYYSSEDTTVNFFRNLAANNYKIVILRVHGAIWLEKNAIALFTSETYDESKYIGDQMSFYLGRAAYSHQMSDEPGYFAITANFVKNAMRGNFNQTTIIIMSCYGLEYPDIAEAFIEKGAQVCTGWDGSVSASHTDETTIILLKNLLIGEQTIEQAIENTMNEKGPDPFENSSLTYYPHASGQLKVLKTSINNSFPQIDFQPFINLTTKMKK